MRLPNYDDPSSSPEKCARRWKVLEDYMPTGSVGAEIGTFKGNFAEYLLLSQPQRLYLVDPWFRAISHWRWAKGNRSTVDALMSIMMEYRNEIDAGKVVPRVEYSYEFLSRMKDGSLDWVYLDTTHDYEGTREELVLCMRKVRAGGYILGDDYESNPAHKHYGVYKAVHEVVAAENASLALDGVERQFVVRVND